MKKRLITLAVTSLGILLVGPIVLSILFPWSDFNCQHQEINIKTGHARFSQMLWFVKISERTEETPLSRDLDGQIIDIPDIKSWHRANTFSAVAKHSPHYRFHGALFQANQLDMFPLPLDRKRAYAISILTAWQQSRSCDRADAILDEFLAEASRSNQ